METSSLETCACPGCDQPGTNRCSACKTTLYCGSICQTADWVLHKEECPGHLRKIGMANLEKAKGFRRENNWQQTLYHADLAATKLKQLKDHPIEDVDTALELKYHAHSFQCRFSEALECAKERYCLYLTKHTHAPAIVASFALIQSCIHNKEFFDACLYARTTWETITRSQDSHIPEHLQQPFTARGAKELARALQALAQHGGMSAEEKQEAGKEAIMLARKALEIDTQLNGLDSLQVGNDMAALAMSLNFFNDVDDDEVIRLYEQSTAIYAQIEGNLSMNVAANEYNMGAMYFSRAKRAADTHDLDRNVANLELALQSYREADRIFRAINAVNDANDAARQGDRMEELLRLVANIMSSSGADVTEG